MGIRYFAMVLLVCGVFSASAQYVPNSSQGFQFASGFNPAFSGVESHGDLKLGYRYQWAGFGDNAPKFVNVGFNIRIKQPVDLTTHAPRMSNSSSIKSASFIPAGKRTVQGIGVNFFHESNSFVVHTGGAVNYAFHYPVSKNVKLAVGVSGVIESVKLDVNKIYLGSNADPDPLYQRLMRDGASHVDVSARAGLLLYSNNFYFGASYLDVFNKIITTSSDSSEFSQPFYKGSMQGGISFEAAPGVFIRPSLLALMNYENKFSIDYSVKAFIQEKVWFGLTYRDIKSAVVLLGFNVNQTFSAAYSYEMSMGGMKKFNDGSHELVLALKFNNLKRPGINVW